MPAPRLRVPQPQYCVPPSTSTSTSQPASQPASQPSLSALPTCLPLPVLCLCLCSILLCSSPRPSPAHSFVLRPSTGSLAVPNKPYCHLQAPLPAPSPSRQPLFDPLLSHHPAPRLLSSPPHLYLSSHRFAIPTTSPPTLGPAKRISLTCPLANWLRSALTCCRPVANHPPSPPEHPARLA